MVSAPLFHYNGGTYFEKLAKILWGKTSMGGVKNFFGVVIFITTLSLFHLFSNSQHPEKRRFHFFVTANTQKKEVFVL